MKEVLGPRGGRYETLGRSPLDEYITGVLAPAGARLTGRNVDAEAEIPVEGLAEEREDEDLDPGAVQPPLLAPALDPKARPHSIGLSFVVETTDSLPSLDICATWARYDLLSSGEWKRAPRCALLRGIRKTSTFYLGGDGNLTSDPGLAESSLHVLIDEYGSTRSLVRIYLVNRLQVESASHVGVEQCLFQPQVRVVCCDGTRVVPQTTALPKSEEEEELDFLYRNKPVLARGYLCSALWRDIDPEGKAFGKKLDFPRAANEPPFCWVDGDLLPEHERARFSPPCVRTEFVPMYLAQSPQMDWDDNYGPSPELAAEALAELWDPSALHQRLHCLVDAYDKWIKGLTTTKNSLPPHERVIAGRLIDRCQAAARRITRGIQLLVDCDDARLSFCFAMKVMAVQATWPVGQSHRPLVWRPFQLAFILMTLESLVNPASTERNICDLLWVPTGAGKTEAYLAIAAFTLAYRRRRALRGSSTDRTGAGVAVISRYTLRLLTIQQFRRALKMITACEYLRVWGLGTDSSVGWRPASCTIPEDFIWGSSRFSIGLWVGGGVTPNHLDDAGNVPGALSILRGTPGPGEPAQVLNCPACDSILSVPEPGLMPGEHTLHLVLSGSLPSSLTPSSLSSGNIEVRSVTITCMGNGNDCQVLSVGFLCKQQLNASEIDHWWDHVQRRVLKESAQLMAVRASRPGYYVRWYKRPVSGDKAEYDFEVFCPNPECPLHQPWCEGMPSGWVYGKVPGVLGPTGGVAGIPKIPDGNRLAEVCQVFVRCKSPYVADRIPVPAWTVDDQVYHRCPSLVIATVDKFARPAFEPRATALLGNVEFHHCVWGYYRRRQHRHGQGEHPNPYGSAHSRNSVSIQPLDPPDLILQDELHLIEGPLGSLAGVYEMAVDYLCAERTGVQVKYIASTATVRNASDQVKAVFLRDLAVFPPPGLSIDDRFFLRTSEDHPLEDRGPSRLYVGVCAPGRGPLTPIVRIWAQLLQTAWHERHQNEIDPFWTLTGYFNAVRELAGARALYRQDIPERLDRIARDVGCGGRELADDRCQELSSRVGSTELPSILALLERPYPGAQDALFTTSMFGTGIDISRIGLMVVHGQPKSTSSYIQVTGRVGRSRGALVVTFFRASRPRDLSHYEFFCGYHRQLGRFVEAITVTPFAPGALSRAIGPVAVFILRNMMRPSVSWDTEATAAAMAHGRMAPEVQAIVDLAERRACGQPTLLSPPSGDTQKRTAAALDDWARIAASEPGLRYVEYGMFRGVSCPVVLGDPQHHHAGLPVVYQNVPQSLREIEETCSFQTR